VNRTVHINGRRVQPHRVDKVLLPDDGLTKGDLIACHPIFRRLGQKNDPFQDFFKKSGSLKSAHPRSA
jgi:hypothetical protein